MKIIITENQLNTLILKEENEKLPRKDFSDTNNKATSSLWDFIRGEERFIGYTYDDQRKWKDGKPIKYTGGTKYGTLTIGYGHTGDDVKKNMTITKPEAEKILDKDINEAAGCIRRILSAWKKDEKLKCEPYKVTQGMYEAMISLVFNAGCQSVRNSDWIQDVKKCKYEDASDKIVGWRKPNEKRRKLESELFCSDGCSNL